MSNHFNIGKFIFNKETCLVEIEYLNQGIVPYSFYFNKEKDSLELCLADLNEEDRHKAKRKYRKLLRKTKKSKRKFSSSFVGDQNAVYYHLLTKVQNRERIAKND